jgi:cytoskeletal protein RodZ
MSEDTDMGMTPPEEGGNRIFLIAAIILGVVFVLALISLFAFWFLTQGQPAQPPPQNATATMVAQLGGTQTAAVQATQTRQAQAQQTAAITATFTRSPTATRTPTITVTPVVFATILQFTNTSTATIATVGASQTATRTTGTPSPPAKTATRTAVTGLPQTGFAESSGFWGLLILAGASLMIIILARQLRLNRAKR